MKRVRLCLSFFWLVMVLGCGSAPLIRSAGEIAPPPPPTHAGTLLFSTPQYHGQLTPTDDPQTYQFTLLNAAGKPLWHKHTHSNGIQIDPSETYIALPAGTAASPILRGHNLHFFHVNGDSLGTWHGEFMEYWLLPDSLCLINHFVPLDSTQRWQITAVDPTGAVQWEIPTGNLLALEFRAYPQAHKFSFRLFDPDHHTFTSYLYNLKGEFIQRLESNPQQTTRFIGVSPSGRWILSSAYPAEVRPETLPFRSQISIWDSLQVVDQMEVDGVVDFAGINDAGHYLTLITFELDDPSGTSSTPFLRVFDEDRRERYREPLNLDKIDVESVQFWYYSRKIKITSNKHIDFEYTIQ
ncbi:MAG: hypothetical protein D6675_08385 [Gemmatimonadetes bacterium]|nr:MAG: hypothetical protein D6675_08385 [Gemmatimonadota bacterium]